jgi:hypothetical protein
MKMKNHLVAKQPRLARPFNLYNIFFVLERLRLIQLAGVHGASGQSTCYPALVFARGLFWI